jgi:hypothetical protein
VIIYFLYLNAKFIGLEQVKLFPQQAVEAYRVVVSVTDPYVRILGFLDRRRNLFFQVAPQLYSLG